MRHVLISVAALVGTSNSAGAADTEHYMFCVATDYTIDATFLTTVFPGHWRDSGDAARAFERHLNSGGANIALNDASCEGLGSKAALEEDRLSKKRAIESGRFKYAKSYWTYSKYEQYAQLFVMARGSTDRAGA